jgi:hypothetical protein
MLCTNDRALRFCHVTFNPLLVWFFCRKGVILKL